MSSFGGICCTQAKATYSNLPSDARVLRPGEFGLIPRSLHESQLHFGIDFEGSWGQAECSCVLIGEDGGVLGVIGRGALTETDGVCFDTGGSSAFAFCIDSLDDCIHRLVFVATWVSSAQSPRTPIKSDLPANTAGPGEAYLSLAGMGKEWALCRMRFQLPPGHEGAVVMLMAVHVTNSEPYHLQVIGKSLPSKLGVKSSATHLAMPVCVLEAELRSQLDELKGPRMVGLPTREQPSTNPVATVAEISWSSSRTLFGPSWGSEKLSQAAAPEAEPGSEYLLQALAAAKRLERAGEEAASEEQTKAEHFQELLAYAQTSFQKVREGLQDMQRSLESWRREALTRPPKEVAEMLSSLPTTSEVLQGIFVAAKNSDLTNAQRKPSVRASTDELAF